MGGYTPKNEQTGLKCSLLIYYRMEVSVKVETIKRLKTLREQRSRVKNRLNELKQTTGDTNIDEELRLFNYWKGELDTCKSKFEKVVRDHKIVESHYQNRYDSAKANLEAAKNGKSNPIKVQEIRLATFEDEIDECEASLEGRKSKRLIRAEAMVEEIIIKQMMDEVALLPKPITTTPVIKKLVKQCKPKIESNPPA